MRGQKKESQQYPSARIENISRAAKSNEDVIRLPSRVDALSPCALGQVALHFELGELRFVVGVGAESVANGEADVVGGHDLADVVPMGVEGAFFAMGEAPFRHDGTAAADDAGHADEAQEDAGVDGEVIDALVGLLDEGVLSSIS